MKSLFGRLPPAILTVIIASAVMAGSIVSPTWSHYQDTTMSGVNSFSAASSFYRAEVLADAPVSYWRLGESSGTTAIDELATSHGTYAGGYTLGIVDALANDANTAVDFDGLSGRVSVPDAPHLQLSTRVSVEAWVRPDTVTGSRRIVNKGNQYRLYIFDGNTTFGVLTPQGVNLSVTTSSVTTGTWQHLVGTFDGTTVILYRNGQSVAAELLQGTIQTGSEPLTIGAFDETGSFFAGGIDEVAVYNQALTPSRVLTHYQRGALTRS